MEVSHARSYKWVNAALEASKLQEQATMNPTRQAHLGG